jgi:hypothetical protein
MPESYFQLSVKNQASAIDAASDASGRAPHLLEVQGEKGLSNRFSRHFNDLVRLVGKKMDISRS